MKKEKNIKRNVSKRNSMLLKECMDDIEPYTRQFQFKILHNIVATNSILFKWKIISSPSCSFCQIYKETADHLLIECIPVRTLWRKLQDWWNTTVRPPEMINLSNKEKKYGVEIKSHQDIILNILLIETRITIFKSREKFKPPEMTEIIAKLRTRREIERRTEKLRTNHEKRWSSLQDKI